MKKLFAGPFCGEFGWEVMTWQSYLRGISPEYDYIVVCGPTGHEAMYSDFCDKYVPYDAPTLKANMWMNETYDAEGLKHFRDMFALDESNADWITPNDVWKPLLAVPKWEKLIGLNPRKFIRFGKPKDGSGYDIIYHARCRDDWDSGFRNWDATEFIDSFGVSGSRLIKACIGQSWSASYCGGACLRNIPLSDLVNVLASARVFVGPISGPVHLAALCGTPIVTWATKAEHMQRVKDVWNPFNTKVECICADDSVWKNRTPWTPDVNDILTLTHKVLDVKVSVPV